MPSVYHDGTVVRRGITPGPGQRIPIYVGSLADLTLSLRDETFQTASSLYKATAQIAKVA